MILARSLWFAPVKLDAKAGELIREHLGEDIGRLSSLLDVLGAAYGEGTKVSAAEVQPFLGEAGATAPWDLTDAIDRGDPEAALNQLATLTLPRPSRRCASAR